MFCQYPLCNIVLLLGVGVGLLLCFVSTALLDTADTDMFYNDMLYADKLYTGMLYTDMLYTGFLIPFHHYTTTAFVIANIISKLILRFINIVQN